MGAYAQEDSHEEHEATSVAHEPKAEARADAAERAEDQRQEALVSIGRPRKYQDPQHFADKVDAYFARVEKSGSSPMLAELALDLGFCDRQSFTEYEDYEPEFSLTVKKARTRIEVHRQKLLIGRDTFTPGVIFDLKNNHGWKDKTETEHSGNPLQGFTVNLVGANSGSKPT